MRLPTLMLELKRMVNSGAPPHVIVAAIAAALDRSHRTGAVRVVILMLGSAVYSYMANAAAAAAAAVAVASPRPVVAHRRQTPLLLPAVIFAPALALAPDPSRPPRSGPAPGSVSAPGRLSAPGRPSPSRHGACARGVGGCRDAGSGAVGLGRRGRRSLGTGGRGRV